jgi:hypothetical protein
LCLQEVGGTGASEDKLIAVELLDDFVGIRRDGDIASGKPRTVDAVMETLVQSFQESFIVFIKLCTGTPIAYPPTGGLTQP